MTEKQLLALKEEIEEAKSEVSKLEGRREQMMDTLKKDWDCETLEEAETKLEKMRKDFETLEEQIQEGLEELDEKYKSLDDE